jgi:hypothetical protein
MDMAPFIESTEYDKGVDQSGDKTAEQQHQQSVTKGSS